MSNEDIRKHHTCFSFVLAFGLVWLDRIGGREQGRGPLGLPCWASICQLSSQFGSITNGLG